MASGDVRAGRAYVELHAKSDAFAKGMNAASARLKSFGSSVTAVGGFVTALSAGALAGLSAAVMKFVGAGSDLNDMAGRLTMNAQELAELGYAAKQTGASLNDVEKATRNMRAGGFGTSFTDMAEEIAAIQDPLERGARMMEVFGKTTGSKLKPMIEQMAELRAEARSIGVGLSDKDVKLADALGDAYGKLQATVESAVLQIGAAVAPMALDIVNRVQSIASVVAVWIRENREVFVTIAKVAAGGLALGTALMGLGATISTVGVVLGAVATGGLVALKVGLLAIGAAIGMVISPLGLFVGLVTAVTAPLAAAGAAWLTWTESGKMARDVLAGGFQSLLGVLHQVTDVVGGIGRAMLSGNFSAAGKVAFLGLKLAAIESLIAIQGIVKTAITNMAIIWDTGLQGWLKSWGSFGAAIKTDVVNIAKALQAAMSGAFDEATRIASGIGKGAWNFDVSGFIAGAIDDSALKDLAGKTRKELEAELGKIRAGKSEAPTPSPTPSPTSPVPFTLKPSDGDSAKVTLDDKSAEKIKRAKAPKDSLLERVLESMVARRKFEERRPSAEKLDDRFASLKEFLAAPQFGGAHLAANAGEFTFINKQMTADEKKSDSTKELAATVSRSFLQLKDMLSRLLTF